MIIDQPQDSLCLLITVANQRGLHARAAARFVKIAESFDAEISVAKESMKVSARSIMGLMMLAAATGTVLQICAAGREAVAALDALGDFAKRKFDEE
jgi:phosphocarrier protein